MTYDELEMLLTELESQGFFGSLELKFEHGRIVLMKKIETIKTSCKNPRDNRGESHERCHEAHS